MRTMIEAGIEGSHVILLANYRQQIPPETFDDPPRPCPAAARPPLPPRRVDAIAGRHAPPCQLRVAA